MNNAIAYIKKEINKAEAENANLNSASMLNPFGRGINLAETATRQLAALEPTVLAEIKQRHRIEVMKQVLKEITNY